MSSRLAIVHAPTGSDHPYQVVPEERTPRDPVGGDMVSVGFLTTPGGAAKGVRFYWERNGRPQTPVHGRPVSVGQDNDRWLVELGVLEAGDTVEYWMVADGGDATVESPRYRFATRRRRTLAGISALKETPEGLLLSTLANDGNPGPTLALRLLDQAGGIQLELDGSADSYGRVATRPNNEAIRPNAAPIILAAGTASLAIAPTTGWISYVANGASVPMRLRWVEEADGTLATVELSAELTDDEALVGLGERFDTLDQRGRAPDVAVYEQYKNHGNRTYLPIPFVISSRGYACLVEGTGHVAYDFGRTAPDRWTCTAQAGGGKPLAIDLFVGDPAACVGALTARTGRPAAPPPDWAFGLWMSSNEWNTQARVEREAALHQEHGIPATVLVIEAWSDENTFYIWNGAQYTPREGNWKPTLADFTFPADGPWPNPKAMTDALHAQGIRLILWQIPALKYIAEPHPQHEADSAHAQDRGYVLRGADGEPYRNPAFWFNQAMIPDFTSPEATAWWMSKRAYLLDELGVDGFKTDGGEHLQGRGITASDGRKGDELVNAYPNLYIGAYHRFATERRKGDAMTFSRAGHTGVGAFPAHWAGDENSNWEAFRRSITAGLTVGLSGVPYWGWDIAGFSEALPTAELYLRAMAMAAFCPIMQYHSEYTPPGEPSKDRTPWRIQEHTGDDQIIPISRYFARLRMALIPYLVREAAYSADSGLPMLRALCLDYPADPASWRTSDQYMLGRDLLVAPVVYEGAAGREVNLPPGVWYDFWSGERLEGGRQLSVGVPIDRIPVYVRAGAILPFHLAPGQALGDDVGTGTTPSHLTLRIYPAENSTGTVVLNGETVTISASVDASGAVRVSLPPLPIPATVTLPDGRSATAAASDQPQDLLLR